MSTADPKKKPQGWFWLILFIPIPAFLLPWHLVGGVLFATLLALAYFGGKSLHPK